MRIWQAALVTILAVPIIGAAIYNLSTPNQGSFLMKGTNLVLWGLGKPLADPVGFVQEIEARTGAAEAPVPDDFRTRYDVTEDQTGPWPVITITPKGASNWNILYTHGGAYVYGLTANHWAIIEQLMAATGATVTVPLYPLAPESDNRVAYPFVIDVYKKMLETTSPENIVLAGDSAGGGLALGQAIEYRDTGLPPPARLILFSPWLDLTLADPAAKEVEPRDAMLGIDTLRISGEWWAGGDDPKAPRLSPLYADVSGLPPMDVFQGTNDLFVVDARTFVQKVEAAGGSISYSEYAGAFHVFVAATWTSEAKDAYERIGQVLAP